MALSTGVVCDVLKQCTITGVCVNLWHYYGDCVNLWQIPGYVCKPVALLCGMCVTGWHYY